MDATIPTRLADRAYLAAYDLERRKFTGGNLTLVLTSAILIELNQAGVLVDEAGRVAVSPNRRVPAVSGREADVVALVRNSAKPKKWKHWCGKELKPTKAAVEARLRQQRLIGVEQRRLLGLFDWPKVDARDTRVVRELRERCRRTVLGGTPVGKVEPLDAALVAIVAAAEWNSVFTGRERRANRVRVRELTEHAGPAASALKSELNEYKNASAAGA